MLGPPPYGANPEEWAAAKRLAFRDLLPVVSNPHVKIGDRSRMKQLGKTPSLIIETASAGRIAIGFSEWTENETTLPKFQTWSRDPDLGVCIQTRRIRALDIDVPDEELAERIAARFAELIEEEGGTPLGLRSRPGTGKKLLAFIAEGDLEKRSFIVKEWEEWDEARGKDVTKRWIVELLADGQQFVAIGTHPSGDRYEWAGGFPKELPSYDLDRVDRAWRVLTQEFAMEGVDRRASRRDPTLLDGEAINTTDPVAEWLLENWECYDQAGDKLFIRCPNEAAHSIDNGPTQSAWLFAGTGGYRRGHFRCMHEGCAQLYPRDDPFFRAIGYKPVKAEEFEDLSLAEDELVRQYVAAAPSSPKAKEIAKKARLPLPYLERKGGKIVANLKNVIAMLTSWTAIGCELRFDEFSGDMVLSTDGVNWSRLSDADRTRLCLAMYEWGMDKDVSPDLLRRALYAVGDEQRIDLAKEWLLNVVPAWDGVPRVRTFWPRYMRTADTPYHRALGDYTWTAQVDRILNPGCQVDMVPVMVSPEGYAKTSVVAALSPSREFFSEFNLQHEDKELARQGKGKLVVELSELRGFSVRDSASIKSWITRREEEIRPLYVEGVVKLPRRFVCYGTTNDDDFLEAHMGQRRWLPALITAPIDLEMLRRDLLQLWAEARELFLLEGQLWREVDRLAGAERQAFEHVDAWHDTIGEWLDQPTDLDGVMPRAKGDLRWDIVARECLRIDPRALRKPDQQRIGRVLKAHGLQRIQRKIDGRNTKVWVDPGLDTAPSAGEGEL